MDRRAAGAHTAICGFKEYIFSHKAGALASFAAATEYAFATVIQRDMARGNVSAYYFPQGGDRGTGREPGLWTTPDLNVSFPHVKPCP